MKESDFEPSPQSDWILISQGAEARVYKLKMANADNENAYVICKERFSKSYRHPDLDSRLTKSRCRSEAKLLEKCAKKADIRVPKVIRVSPPRLYLEYLDGPSVKSYLQQQKNSDSSNGGTLDDIIPASKTASNSENSTTTRGNEYIKQNAISEMGLANMMGELLGRLHNIGIVHGDLTTSNMMIVNDADDEAGTHCFKLALIDFGLSKSTYSPEEQAVDLYVLQRALLSTHPNLTDKFFDQVLTKYKSITEMSDLCDTNSAALQKRKNQQTTLQRLEQVRKRGRKRECFG